MASAAGAAAADTHATGTAGSDVVVALGVGAGVALVSAGAARWAWSAAALLTALVAAGPWVAAPLAVLALVGVTRAEVSHHRLVGAIVGAALVQTLLRLPHGRFDVNLVASLLVVGCLTGSAWSTLDRAGRDRGRRLLRVGGGIVGIVVGGLVASVALARGDVGDGIGRAQDGLAAARAGESAAASEHFERASEAFAAAHDDLDVWWARPARVLPVVGQHARALDVLAGEGADLAAAAATSARSAPIDDLQVVDGRLDLDLVRSMAEPLAEVRAALDRADDGVAAADSDWLVPPVADQVDELERAIASAADDAAAAAEAVAVLPDILGGSGPRSYFVAFGTPAETRELGGFMGAYALLGADDGELTLASTGRVRNLNEYFAGQRLTDPSAFPDHYLGMLPQRFWHNITGTPDFPTAAEALRQLWRAPRAGPIDGVLYMDPVTLADLLDLSGPIRVPDHDAPLTADTAADFLLRDQYVEFPDDDRHDFLVEAAETVFDELMSGELAGPRVLADTLAPAVAGRRLLFHSFHPDEQALFERLNVDGALPPVAGDFLSVRASNRGLNKIDAFMQRTVAYDVTVDPVHDRVTATVTVTIRNDAPASGLPYAIIGNRLGEPLGTSSTTLAVYSPLELVDVTQDGRSVSRGASDVYDRHRYTVLLDIAAESEVTIVFELAGTVDLRGGYHLEVVPQPLVNDDHLEVAVRGAGGWIPVGHPELVTDLRKTEELDVSFIPRK